MYILFRQLNFRHQFIGYDLQHFFQLGQVIGAEPLFGTLHDQMQVRIADVIVINVLLGRPQAVFPLIGGGLDALHIAFFDQLGVERFIMWLNCAIVGSPSAMMTSMQKDSTVVSVASRSSKRLKICL